MASTLSRSFQRAVKRMRRTSIVTLGLALLLLACGQETAPNEGAQLTGPDRMERLIEAAQAEGTVSVYSTVTVEDMVLLNAAFENKYGVRVELWRGSASDILQRATTEARAGRFSVDVIEAPGSEMESIRREGLFTEVELPEYADLMEGAHVQGREWVATRLIIFAAGYNTNLVDPADLPKSYYDLLDPKWQGKLGIEATDFNLFMSLTDALGGDAGVQLFRDIQATNGLSVRMGHSLLGNLVISGEVPLGINLYRHFLEPAKRSGAPVFAVPSGAAVAARAPHPNAAVLYMEFLLTDAQEIYESRDNTATNLKYQNLPEDLEFQLVDVQKYVDEIDKWRPLYRDVITGTE
jgi:iron(III) transport system substrate-binding protein